MSRPLVLVAGLLLAPSWGQAQDAIPADTVAAVKRATVFVRVRAGTSNGSGSGFVVAADKDSVLIATNYHVLSPLDREARAALTPGELAKSLKAPTVTVVFDGGTAAERSSNATAVAADPEADLAILRVAGLAVPPGPIDYAAAPKLSETMPVYTFGFPFGQALATGKGAPAVTVGRGAVSSLRLDEAGALAVVQIDGALNPGNSGGPVVDGKGRLVGVAVATVRNGQGIGFAVPAAELAKVLGGRLGRFHLTATRAGGKLTVRAEVGVIDPAAAVRGVTLHYLVVPPGGTKPDGKDPVGKHPAAKKLRLTTEGGVAAGELTLDAADGELLVQAVPEGGPGAAGTSAVRSFGLGLPKGAAGAVVLGPAGAVPAGSGAGEVPAPAGWKEYTAANKTYKVWLPEAGTAGEKQRTLGKLPGQRLTLTSVVVDMPGGQTYLAEQIILVPPPRVLDRDAVMKILRDVATGDAPGARVVREAGAKMGRFPGTEFLIERGGSATRARGFVIGSSIYLLRAVGTRDQVEAAESVTFLDSCRLQVPNRPPAGGPGGAIAGGRNDPEFSDPVPAGGVLVGLEVGLGPAGADPAVKAVRAVFRVGDEESAGPWHGPTGADAVKETVRVVARPGYAVGGFSVRTGPGISGLSVTFMKVAGGKLDPADSYESEWVGVATGPGPVKIGGTGEAARGLTGKATAAAASGIGLLYREAGRKEPPPAVNRGPRIQGGGNAEFKDIGPADGLLVGLEVGLGKFFNNDIVVAARPVYRVGDEESLGGQYGTDTSRVVRVIAKPGYAVGALTLKTGLGVDGVSLTFMKAADGKLDPADSYESEWVGGTGGGGPVKVGGDGTAVTGLLGKTNPKDVTGLGLAYTGERPWPAGKPTEVRGGGDIEHRDGAPAGGLLVGLEVGIGKFFNNDVVKAVRPVYRVGDEESLGEQYGTDTTRVVRVVARPGYAVGAIQVKTGLGLTGLSVIFMKAADGRLDPADNYESEWVGGTGGGLVRITGEGTPVIGLVAKTNKADATGIGLLLTDADKK